MSADVRLELARIARRMLAGEVDSIEGCRILVRLHGQTGDADDEAMRTIIGVESETDDLPVGGERVRWSPRALDEKDRKRDEYLARVLGSLTEALEVLARRYVAGDDGNSAGLG